jgi:hypothetical protein
VAVRPINITIPHNGHKIRSRARIIKHPVDKGLLGEVAVQLSMDTILSSRKAVNLRKSRKKILSGVWITWLLSWGKWKGKVAGFSRARGFRDPVAKAVRAAGEGVKSWADMLWNASCSMRTCE